MDIEDFVSEHFVQLLLEPTDEEIDQNRRKFILFLSNLFRRDLSGEQAEDLRAIGLIPIDWLNDLFAILSAEQYAEVDEMMKMMYKDTGKRLKLVRKKARLVQKKKNGRKVKLGAMGAPKNEDLRQGNRGKVVKLVPGDDSLKIIRPVSMSPPDNSAIIYSWPFKNTWELVRPRRTEKIVNQANLTIIDASQKQCESSRIVENIEVNVPGEVSAKLSTTKKIEVPQARGLMEWLCFKKDGKTFDSLEQIVGNIAEVICDNSLCPSGYKVDIEGLQKSLADIFPGFTMSLDAKRNVILLMGKNGKKYASEFSVPDKLRVKLARSSGLK